MFQVQIKNEISSSGLDQFNSEPYEISTESTNPDAILLRSYVLHEEEIPDSVRVIARAGAGVNNVPVEACTRRGVVVFNTPGANANSVKELVIAGMLLSARKIHEGISWTEIQKTDETLSAKVEKNKKLFGGMEISGKRLGVVGLGAIGVLVANAASALGMDVYGYDPYISINAAWGLSSHVKRCEKLEQLVKNSDFVSLHVPLSKDTENLINEQLLSKAGKGLRILNFSRGGLVENKAIKEALQSGTISAYITDFPSSDILGEPGVLSIPHLGASTAEAEENCAVMAVRQIRDYLEYGNITNSVNFPSCSLDYSEGVRIVVVNRNIPNMLTQILSVLANRNLNVENMINRHRNNVAYNIIDLSTESLQKDIFQEITAIEGVIMARQI